MQSITSNRLQLEPLSHQHVEAMVALCADPVVMRYIIGGPYLPEITRNKVSHWMAHAESRGFGLWVIRLQTNQQIAGLCGLLEQYINQTEDIELGYRLWPQFWGQGIATEAAQMIRDVAQEQHRLSRLISVIHPNNIGSIRVAQKVGMALGPTSSIKDIRVLIYQMDLHPEQSRS